MKADSAIFTAFEEHKGPDSAESERNLMRSILTLAMDDMRRGGDKFRDARRFFLSNESEYLFSFLSICNHLAICPTTIRMLVGVLPTRVVAQSLDDQNQIAA